MQDGGQDGTPVVRICRVRALKKTKYQLLIALLDIRDVRVLVV